VGSAGAGLVSSSHHDQRSRCCSAIDHRSCGQVGQQAEHERSGTPAGFDSGELAGDAAEQLVEE
jgi:hypothetical protein